MAHILPETSPQALPIETLRVFRALKSLPDRFFAWHHLAPWQPHSPDFLVLDENGRALLVKVSGASADQAVSAAQLLLIEDTRVPLGEVENKVLSSFVEKLQLMPDKAPGKLVVFPNIPQKQLNASHPIHTTGDPHWAGRELLQNEDGNAWQTYFPATPVDPLSLEKIRQQFTPEVVVSAEMTVRPSNMRRLEAGLSGYLLDYDQESAVKTDLDLPPEGQSLANEMKLNIINGVAGSGKTLILLYRLRLLYHFYPEKQYLALTHNRPLSHDMRSRFIRLMKREPTNIEWCTFNGWCYHHYPPGSTWTEPVTPIERAGVIHQVWQEHLKNTSISERMLLSEIDWLKDQLPMNQDNYLTADRRGRGFGLNNEQRKRMLAAMSAYQKIMEQRRLVDWGDIPQRIWHSLTTGEMRPPAYDIILVDEAQFFAPLWIAIIQRLLKPQNAHLFLVADPTQGFLGRGASWRSLGLEARGRTHMLRRSYRTTREIMQFATLFYRLRLGEEKDDDILAPDLFNMPDGVFPQIIPLASPQDEISRVANEIAGFVQQGMPKRHLLALHADGQGAQKLIQAINRRLGKDAAIDPKNTYPGDYVRVTTLNAGAGLESPIVFLVGLHRLFEEEQSLRLSDDEREALIRDNTRKVYMAATRAGQRLVFSYVGDLPEVITQVFAEQSS